MNKVKEFFIVFAICLACMAGIILAVALVIGFIALMGSAFGGFGMFIAICVVIAAGLSAMVVASDY